MLFIYLNIGDFMNTHLKDNHHTLVMEFVYDRLITVGDLTKRHKLEARINKLLEEADLGLLTKEPRR